MAVRISEVCVDVLRLLHSIPTAQSDGHFVDILLPVHKHVCKSQMKGELLRHKATEGPLKKFVHMKHLDHFISWIRVCFVFFNYVNEFI